LDREEAILDWLNSHDWRRLATGGSSPPGWCRLAGKRRGCRGRTTLEGAAVAARPVETELLINEIEDSAARISTLVGAAKRSQLDRPRTRS
jgi:hypothetical protein